MSPESMPHDWCPECDGTGECPPGTCPGRPYPALAEAEGAIRSGAIPMSDLRGYATNLLIVMAEYDRRGAKIQGLDAELNENVGVMNALRRHRDTAEAALSSLRAVERAAGALVDSEVITPALLGALVEAVHAARRTK